MLSVSIIGLNFTDDFMTDLKGLHTMIRLNDQSKRFGNVIQERIGYKNKNRIIKIASVLDQFLTPALNTLILSIFYISLDLSTIYFAHFSGC